MTDRISSLTVVLEVDMRDDDVAPLVAAIERLRGVLTVTGRVVDSCDFIAESRVRSELGGKLWDVLYPKRG
jgi:hypothetical protein